MRISLVTEAYNLAEGQSEAAFRRALQTLQALAARADDAEVLVVDPSPGGAGRTIVAEAGAGFRYLELPGVSYDSQKNRAVEEASGEVVVFLDGDCRPAADSWLACLMSAFANPRVEGVAGLTLYDDRSLLGKAMSVLDWGYLFRPPGAVVGCYASNNVAFRRATWLACPPADGQIRCNCYAHAQALIRAGRPLVMQPAALALHELPDVRAERWRRGYDLVGACWSDPQLPETEWLEPSEQRVEQFMALNRKLDEQRLREAPMALRITPEEQPRIWTAMTGLRLIDREGVRAALEEGEARGWNAAAKAARRRSLTPA